MTSFARTAGGMGVAMLAGAVCTAPAEAAVRHQRFVAVPCSSAALAGAIGTANAAPSLLRLAPFCTYLITTALPQVTGVIDLLGGPATSIKRDPATLDTRLLDVAFGGRLRARGITLLNGVTTTAPGGGIRNAGTLVLDHVTLSGNTAMNNNGGAVENTGTALVAHSVLAANATRGPMGNRDGGAIHNDGTLTVFASRLAGNIAVRDGGAIFTTAGHTTRVIQTTISSNTAANTGGGIANSGATTLIRTLVRFNQAIGNATAGGGVQNATGTVTLRRSLITTNSPGNCAPAGSVPGCAS
jgi:hypothetical protein